MSGRICFGHVVSVLVSGVLVLSCNRVEQWLELARLFFFSAEYRYGLTTFCLLAEHAFFHSDPFPYFTYMGVVLSGDALLPFVFGKDLDHRLSPAASSVNS
jgi:hypothetical protein